MPKNRTCLPDDNHTCTVFMTAEQAAVLDRLAAKHGTARAELIAALALRTVDELAAKRPANATFIIRDALELWTHDRQTPAVPA